MWNRLLYQKLVILNKKSYITADENKSAGCDFYIFWNFSCQGLTAQVSFVVGQIQENLERMMVERLLIL